MIVSVPLFSQWKGHNFSSLALGTYTSLLGPRLTFRIAFPTAQILKSFMTILRLPSTRNSTSIPDYQAFGQSTFANSAFDGKKKCYMLVVALATTPQSWLNSLVVMVALWHVKCIPVSHEQQHPILSPGRK